MPTWKKIMFTIHPTYIDSRHHVGARTCKACRGVRFVSDGVIHMARVVEIKVTDDSKHPRAIQGEWLRILWLRFLIFFFFFFFYVKAYLGINSMKLKQMAYTI